jgi:hypothetical protein
MSKNDDYSASEVYDILREEQKYLKDHRLPRHDANFEWSTEMLREIVKCRKDILHFAQNYFHIVNLDNGKMRINLYKPQKRILRSLIKHRFVIVCSSRQAGKTTLMTIYALWYTSFFDDKRVIIVANKENTAIQILKRVATAYRQLPNWLKAGVKQYGKKEIIFGNDSSVAISTTSASSLRGESINCLIIDEMAHVEEHIMQEFWASIIPTISSSRKTKVFAVSTPRGTGNMFHSIFTQAEKNEYAKDGFRWHAEKIHWWELPNRGKLWKRDQIDLLGGDIQMFEQEFNNAFLETGDAAIDYKVLDELNQNCRQPLMSFDDGHYKIWEQPDERKIYGIGVDVGEGIGKAASVVQVLDFTDLSEIKQVAVYHDNMIDTVHFAFKLDKIGRHWGCPPMVIERNNCGSDVINFLYHKHHYSNIVSYNPENARYGDIRMGAHSHINTKYTAVSNMRYWINSLRQVRFYDTNTINEFKTFIKYPNGTWKKAKGENIFDDRVMAMAWCLLLLIENVAERYYEIMLFDENGKPARLRTYTVNPPTFMRLDEFFQQEPDAPLPASMGMDAEINRGDSFHTLLSQGWEPVNHGR